MEFGTQIFPRWAPKSAGTDIVNVPRLHIYRDRQKMGGGKKQEITIYLKKKTITCFFGSHLT